jgi:hypothetical protein
MARRIAAALLLLVLAARAEPVVRDLADGARVPLEVPADADRVVADDVTWRVAERTADTVWVYRMVRVRGTVAAADGSDLARIVRLQARVSLEESGPSASNGTWPGRPHLPGWSGLPGPDAKGAFDVEVPRIRGMTLFAHADGWISATARVDFREEAKPVRLTLDRSTELAGVLIGTDGPLPGAGVRVFVVLHADEKGLTSAVLRAIRPKGGFTLSSSAKDNESVATLVLGAKTDAEGRFALDLPVGGELLVVAYPPGHATLVRDRFPDAAGRRKLRLAAAAAPERPRVTFRRGEQALGPGRLMVVDLSLGAVQTGPTLSLDDAGSAPADWLVPGHHYMFMQGREHAFVTWDGGRAVDFAKGRDNADEGILAAGWSGYWRR